MMELPRQSETVTRHPVLVLRLKSETKIRNRWAAGCVCVKQNTTGLGIIDS